LEVVGAPPGSAGGALRTAQFWLKGLYGGDRDGVTFAIWRLPYIGDNQSLRLKPFPPMRANRGNEIRKYRGIEN